MTTSALRRDQAEAVRERILGATIAVIEDDQEPTMRAVARAARVSERTIYRYFAAREELVAALMPLLRARASAPMAQDVDGLEAYVRVLFTTFDRNARLARALTGAAWARKSLTRAANLQALRAVLDTAFPHAPEADRASAAASLRVPLSAAGWAYLADCGFDLESSIAHVQWLVRAVLQRLRDRSGEDHA